MGRINFSDIEHYGSSGGGSFFSLKNDKDVARVRFMMNDAEDLNNYTFVVHRTKVGERYKNVSCLRKYNEPVNKCPFCEQYSNSQPRFFIPLYNMDEKSVQIFERGKTWSGKLSSILSRYGSKTPLVNHIFEIERNGVKGDTQTTYEPYEIEKDETTLDDLPEVPEILGNIYVLDKSADDMNYYIDTDIANNNSGGEFPPEDDEGVTRRGSVSDDFMNAPEGDDEAQEEGRGSRRTSSRNADETRARTDNNRRVPSGSNSGGRRRQF